MTKGKIFQSLSGFYDVHSEGKVYRTRARGNFRKRKITPLVGDDVEFQIEDGDKGYILSMLPRKNSLVRPPIANIDQAIVATAAVQPEFSSNLLDRQLIALEISGITPIIYFTKTDLLTDQQRAHLETIAKGYRAVPYKVIFPEQAFDPSSLDQLRQLFAGKENVIMGQTGAGKSTLLNHLAPDLQLKTGEISAALNRGKHTTRKVALLQVNDGLIADTPGFSSYDTLEIDYRELANYFPEFKRAAVKCRFRGCVHVNEPDCEVKRQVSARTIMESRYTNYLQLYTDIKNRKPIYKK
ncbi:ribosome small subunit-dependent GTPase A [Lentilactobacillus sp. IMAU92037]|uniref:ribosome small subunit-dependent GTPase A n=1 Tax=Lentilactobacillus TaxID=2767893 RepID=UPI001C275CA5|nr:MULTISPECIES: ribosome small subunit-dependent GTPase A [Lentilactobacillus]MBU9788963.1 ribosome small subunit-dependent GTPase A [Lentilactobacillus dabitei]MBV0929932.1 ribosome small subunit-dependent GTPase A [Lentilactobacillus dabitei]MDM7516298.1 ribosome small subunit-dependent GTPase A [Lentilactobacillus sp. TOM.63]